MLQQQMDAFVSARSAELAEQATIRAVLNSYLRETRETDPRTENGPRDSGGSPFLLTLPFTGRAIAGEMTYYSKIGQHAYGASFSEILPDGRRRELRVSSLIDLLLEELVGLTSPDQPEACVRLMKARIENSCRKMSMHIEHYLSQLPTLAEKKLDLVRSEQSLYFGHPFHPYPKSSDGFADDELAKFSPEMGAAFRLHYFAVKKDLVTEEWLDGPEAVLPLEAHSEAKRRMEDREGGFTIVPMHPWQADYVMALPEVQARMERGEIISLGLLGPNVYPTSSVRTVWDPAGGYGFKLPLYVRITNLLRENNSEQTRRTMDAARVLRHLQGQLGADSFQILSETGYSSVRFASPNECPPCFTVIYRPMAVDNETTFVMASLLESYPGEAEPKLIQAIRQSNRGRLPDLSAWLERYLQISMLPMLRLLAHRGISFEAHLQNSLLSIRQGWPAIYYVRDLEGVSIDRKLAERAGWIGTLLAQDSPVLYDEAEAWMRTKYYFFVNHLGSLVHTLSASQKEDEEHGWRIVRELLQQEKTVARGRLLAYIEELLEGDHLPAKANFISCFLKRGETPLFVDIPNPIKG